uniref:Senescence domain-containing protein n=1 Tax=Rhizophora mucronata TaxID=61149 RepID=A0A2P2PIK6_RHIMU
MGGSSSSKSEPALHSEQKNQKTTNTRQEAVLRIPGCTVHLMDEGEAIELAKGEFTLFNVLEKSVPVATIIKVGDGLLWPLTKDEPVVKLDSFHYLFSLPTKDGYPLSYGVTFSEQCNSILPSLDSFLSEHSCFSITTSPRSTSVDWKQFAPSIEDYNNLLARAIAGGSGQIVKGIFMIGNAYSSQIHSGGEMILARATEEKNNASTSSDVSSNKTDGSNINKSGINRSLKRVRNLSKMTENISKALLDDVGLATESVTAPLVKSRAGKAILSTGPGEVLLASLDAVNKILDAAEVAEKQALSATTGATTRMVTTRFGKSAGEATGEVLATTGHCANTAWNISKIRKAINPASSVSRLSTLHGEGVPKNAGQNG